MAYRSHITIHGCPEALNYLTGVGPISATAAEAVGSARSRLPNYCEDKQTVRWEKADYVCEITVTEEESTIKLRDGVAHIGQIVYAVPDWFPTLDGTVDVPLMTGRVTCLPSLSFEANSVDWGQGPGSHYSAYVDRNAAQDAANAERDRRRGIRDQRSALRQRQAEIEREADSLLDAAEKFCLTPDGQHCRPDIWRRLRSAALRWIANESGEGVSPLVKTARAIVPAGSSEGFVLAVARQLANWAECVADAIQDPMSDE